MLAAAICTSPASATTVEHAESTAEVTLGSFGRANSTSLVQRRTAHCLWLTRQACRAGFQLTAVLAGCRQSSAAGCACTQQQKEVMYAAAEDHALLSCSIRIWVPHINDKDQLAEV